tara:strand:- start:668 stop:1411 length:744 start_codon:yes stop_codon:yes gene_type:complete
MIDKAIVFDLDHTLGDFYIVRLIWNFFKKINIVLTEEIFHNLCDVYQKTFRPNLFVILKYLLNKRDIKKNIKLIIYTNNQGGKEWLNLIMGYIDKKMNKLTFDSVIGPYKISGEIVEKCRSKEYKTYHDILHCSKLSKKCEILFLDDQYYSRMNHKKVEYYKIKEYVYYDTTRNILEHMRNIKKLKEISPEFRRAFLQNFRNYLLKVNKDERKTKEEEELDRVVSKTMMIHIQKFLAKPNKYTRKKN